MLTPWLHVALLCLAPPQQAAPAGADPFPRVDAASVAMDPAALDALAQFVQGLIDSDEIVGAELLVIRDSRTVLHRALGWKDREEKLAMEPNTIFCVRSMTKAVVGTGVEMLFESGELERDDPIAEHLAAFDTESCRAITVDHLLHHTSGLPLSSLVGSEGTGIHSLAEVATLSAASGPQFPPGERWSYSDDGADTLGALVERVSGLSLERFLRQRLLDPLGMTDTLTFLADGIDQRTRIASNYAGTKGGWTRYWSPAEPSLFPIFLASQGLYSTPRDYARFLSMWMKNGRAGKTHLLRAPTVQRALQGAVDAGFPTGFRDARVCWGDMTMLWVEGTGAEQELLAFGHGGSDGNFAYAFPAFDLLVLYFTQSRNNQTFLPFEAAVEEHLLDSLRGRKSEPRPTYEAKDLDAIAGIYWEIDDNEPMAILRRGETLVMEFPGKAILELAPARERDRFECKLIPSVWVEIERDASGNPVALLGHNGDHVERHPRLSPAADLPSVEEVLALRERTIDFAALRALGALRIGGHFEMPASKDRGPITIFCDGPARYRSEFHGAQIAVTSVLDGDRAWNQLSTHTTDEDLAGVSRVRFDHPLFAVSDWRALFREMAVLARIEKDGRELFLLRGFPEHGNARYLYLEVQSGRLVEEDRIEPDWGMGEIGTRVRYDDWREVDGVELPHHVAYRYAAKLLGTFDLWCETVEPHAALDEARFTHPPGK